MFRLWCFLFSFVVTIPLASLKVDGIAGVGELSWWIVFLPVWAGNVMNFLMHVVSFANVLVAFRRTTMAGRREAQSNAFKSSKTVVFWNCCTPFAGVLPSVAMLIFVMWFEGMLCAKLAGQYTGSLFVVAIPLYILVVFLILHFLLMRSVGWLAGFGIICATAEMVVVPLRIEGVIGKASWFAVYAPIWTLAAVVIAYV
eukprot:g3199.t1